MNPTPAIRSGFLRPWLIWTAGFLSFPIAGGAAAGRVDSPAAALAAGVVTGAVIGAGQSLASNRRLDPRRWTIATALGMGLGLPLGAVAIGFGTSLADLAVMGALTGLVLGGAQALALPARARYRGAWAAAIPVLSALRWTVTTLAGVDVDKQFTVFGSIGALTSSALTGALLHALCPGAPLPQAPAKAGPTLGLGTAHEHHCTPRDLRNGRHRSRHARRASSAR